MRFFRPNRFTLCDPTPAVETVHLAGKWQPRDDTDHEPAAPADDDTPPLLLLARMRDRLKVLRHELLELRADRTLLEQANDRLIQQRDASRHEAEALRAALTHIGRELEATRAHVGVLTRELAEQSGPAGMAMRTADSELLITPLPTRAGER